jgi:acyl transferase domain-containing protein
MTGKTRKDAMTGLEIAVIGMAGRFPGARNIHEFWNNLIDGVESIPFLSDEELKESGAAPGLLENPGFVKTNGGILEDRECFDAAFFDYTPREAEIMDPQMRVFHECAWKALEDAGYDTESYSELIGLFAGSSTSFYWECLSRLSGKASLLGEFAASQLINKDYLTTRVSYKLDLQGPCTLIHTACSTSLVAVHMACRALLTGECKLALAGGVSVSHGANTGYLFQEGMILSPDGHCRAFDANANGTIGGNGVGVVVLKRLKEALADRDYIYAVVKGSASNNDGIRRVGFTAPSVKGQFEVIRAALRFSRVEPESITYVETHGTGTSLGDPVEIEALKKAFNTDKKGGCAIGSVKTNIGHLDTAAGIAGFVKTVLALTHKKIPPTLHFEKPNPKIDFQDSWFYVNTKPIEWQANGRPLRAGVSSFGQGGANAHVILEEAPEIRRQKTEDRRQKTEGREYQLILLSAKTAAALDKMTGNFVEYLKQNPEINLADAAYTLQVGRRGFKYRQKLICPDVNQAIDALSSPGSRKVQRFDFKTKNKQVVFMFPGIGAQYVNMGLELYQKEQVFRREMDYCFEILRSLVEYDIKEILYPFYTSYSSNEPAASTEKINRFEVAQLVTFIFEYALAKLLLEWGVTPDAMIGYSFGEYIAACVSGVFSPGDALKLIAYRGELLQQIPDGAMMGVPLHEKELSALLNINDELSIAVDNGPSCIVSGPEPAVRELEKQLKEKRIVGIPLKTSKALHSKMMLSILAAFEEKVGTVTLNKPGIPYISNVTGKWITTDDAGQPVYWSKHLSNTVRFDDGMKELVKEGNIIFVEVGPGRDLCTMIERYIDDPDKQQAINLVRPRQSDIPDVYYLLSRMGNLWLYGANIDWSQFYSREKRRRTPLPTYPFEKQHYWIRGDFTGMGIGVTAPGTQIRKNPDISDWFYIPGWRRVGLYPPVNSPTAIDNNRDIPAATQWLVFLNEYGPGEGFAGQLEAEGAEVTVVKQGPVFERVSDREFTIAPQRGGDYAALFKELGQLKRLPNYIAHFWGVSPPDLDREEMEIRRITKGRELDFYSLIYMAKAIENQDILHDIHLSVITTNVQEVTGQEVLCPAKALVMGPLKVIPQEYPYIICRTVDIDLTAPGSSQEKKLIRQLIEEFKTQSLDTVVAYRNNYRWVQEFVPAPWSQPGALVPRLRKAGVYLVTGGMGKIGFLLAEALVKKLGAKLILIGRSVLPDRDEWDLWLNTHQEADPISQKIKKIRRMEKLGGEILVFSADVAHQDQVQQVICRAEQQFGPINGVIHAAGDTGVSISRPIKQLDEAEVNKQFKPKIYGVLTLEALFRDKELDFCLLTSSLSPILGGLGFAAYSAANCFMDAFVYRYNRTKPRGWISVNWGDWDFSKKTKPGIAFGAAANDLLITPGQGVQTFERILYHCRDHQVVVSAGNLAARIDQWVKLRSLREKTPAKKEEAPLYQPRANLENAYVKPANRLEQLLANILQDFLGIREVGTHDNFYELGATSLNIIQINSIARRKLHQDISLMWWFEYPTIKSLSGYLEKQVQENPGGEAAAKIKEKKEKRSQAVRKGKTRMERLKNKR